MVEAPVVKPMRLLQLWSIYGVGGITRHVMDLSEWLRRRGHHVTMAGTGEAWLDRARDESFCELPLIGVTDAGGGRIARFTTALRCAWRLRRILKEQDIQLIHAHESAPAMVANWARMGLDVPVVVTYHGSDPGRVAWFGRVARPADCVVSPSRRGAEALHRIGGVPQEKLRVINYGIAPQPRPDPNDVRRLREQLLGQGRRWIVLTVARLTHQKGIDVLVDVVKRVLETSSEIQFVVVGDGPQEEEAPRWAREAGVASHLDFVGRRDDPHPYMAASDLFLLTSRWEALPLTIVEAFRQALPVVATDCSGVVEMVDDQVGRLVPIGDVEAIANGVLEVLRDEERRKRMSEAAAARGQEERFSPEAVHATFERTYAEILASNP